MLKEISIAWRANHLAVSVRLASARNPAETPSSPRPDVQAPNPSSVLSGLSGLPPLAVLMEKRRKAPVAQDHLVIATQDKPTPPFISNPELFAHDRDVEPVVTASNLN